MKKRRRTNKKPYSRSIVGATLEVIQKKRAEKPEVRDAAREAALRYETLIPNDKMSLLLLVIRLVKQLNYCVVSVKLRRGLRKPKMKRRQRRLKFSPSKRVLARPMYQREQHPRALRLEVVAASVERFLLLYVIHKGNTNGYKPLPFCAGFGFCFDLQLIFFH